MCIRILFLIISCNSLIAAYSTSLPIYITTKKTTKSSQSLSPEAQSFFLSTAIENGHEEKILYYLNTYPGITAHQNPVTTLSPLHQVLRKRSENFHGFRAILAQPETDLLALDQGGNTPLLWCAKHGETIFIRILLNRIKELPQDEQRAIINTQNNDGQTTLHYLVKRRECIKLIKKFLKMGANPNIQNALGQTALYIAAQAGSPDIAQILLQHNANPLIQDHYEVSPLAAAANSNTAVVLQHHLKYVLQKSEV